ncbi:unnamed protein product [Rhodiola kirilowii]
MTTAELKAQLDDVRRHSEEQNQALQTELAGLKDLLQSLLLQQQHPSDPSSSQHTPPPAQPNPTDPGQLSTLRKPAGPHPPLLPGGLATRLSKIEFPKFDGSMLTEWIYRCEQFFLLDSTLGLGTGRFGPDFWENRPEIQKFGSGRVRSF